MAIEMHLPGITISTNGSKVQITVGDSWDSTWTFTPNQARIIALAINASADELEEA